MSKLYVKVGLIGLFDMLKFKNMKSVRDAAIEAAPASDIICDYPINKLARKLHPDYQELVIDEIINHEKAGAKTYVMQRQGGGNPAQFRAGQYLSLKMKIGESYVTRPISISSTPKDASNGKIAITVKTNPGGFAAEHILENWAKGDRIITSDPQGTFYYEPLRDGKNVIALAGGSGITPFLSMAGAIAEGTEDFNLTILFGSRTEDTILFKDELDEYVAKSNGKVKVVHVLSDEEKDGYEHGFITADLIKKYAPGIGSESVAPSPGDYSVFICGPAAMYQFVQGEVAKLGLPNRLVRFELQGMPKDVASIPGYDGDASATYSMTIHQAGETYSCPVAAGEPILVAIERAGVKAPSRCRSAECGWCRSKLLSGDVFVSPTVDGRRQSDKDNGYIHPCATFAKSDIEIEVPSEYWK